MSRLIAALRRVFAGDSDAKTAARLLRERPGPTPRFVEHLRADLSPRWASATRPPAFVLRVTALLTAGLLLVVVAAVIAAS